MTDPVRIFITSCTHMWRAEIALEYSILKYAKYPVEINFIRSGDPEWRTNVDEGIPHKVATEQRPDLWNVGRDHGQCYSREGWATPFSCMRFTIPELCGFEGRAIHLDVDFLVLRDLKDIFESDMPTPLVGPGCVRSDFMLMDCAAFKDVEWWPSIAKMKPSGWNIEKDYKGALKQFNMCSDSPHNWESWDGKDFTWNSNKKQASDTRDGKSFLEANFYAVHYTNMHTQPWKPLPDNFAYPPHPHSVAAYLWWEHYAEAIEKWRLGLFIPQTKIPVGIYNDVGGKFGEAENIELKRARFKKEIEEGTTSNAEVAPTIAYSSSIASNHTVSLQ